MTEIEEERVDTKTNATYWLLETDVLNGGHPVTVSGTKRQALDLATYIRDHLGAEVKMFTKAGRSVKVDSSGG